MGMTLHTLVRSEFRSAMSRHLAQQAAFDQVAALVGSQHPELPSAVVRRLAALMLANEPLEIPEIALPEQLAPVLRIGTSVELAGSSGRLAGRPESIAPI